MFCCKTQHLYPDRCDNIDVYVNSSEAVEIQQMGFELFKRVSNMFWSELPLVSITFSIGFFMSFHDVNGALSTWA